MKRPSDLPNYKAPPLYEVVLGVQFEPVAGYQQIYAGQVWELFKATFPNVEERQSLPPSFETFGANVASRPAIQLSTGASHDRFWFVSKDGDLLLQFQQDRFLQNWRRITSEAYDYPHFEKMLEHYEKNLKKLMRYFEDTFAVSVKINQCEISYVNRINFPPKASKTPREWINFVELPAGSKIDFKYDFKYDFRKEISNKKGEPIGRLIVSAGSAMNEKREEILSYDLSVKGAPAKPDIESALEFLTAGRRLIVTTFTKTTSEKAHQAWERFK